MRGAPTYARWYEDLPEHPKTRAAAAVLVAELGLKPDYAEAVVCRAVPLLVCWAIRHADDGRTGRLADAELVATAWPAAVRPGGALWGADEGRLGALRRALRARPADGSGAPGFLEEVALGRGRAREEVLHGFLEHAWPVLRNRPHYRGLTLEQAVAGAGAASPSPARSSAARPVTNVEPNANWPRTRDEPTQRTQPRTLPGNPQESGLPCALNERADVAGAPFLPLLPPEPNANPNANSQRTSPGNPQESGLPCALNERASYPSPRQGKRRDPGSPPHARGWAGVPEGVRRGELLAVAEWIRGLPPIARLELRDGSVYLRRWREHAMAPLRPEVTAVSPLQPGRLLERLDPEAFAGLVADVASRVGAVEHPVSYCARALGARWAGLLAAQADQAAEERARRARQDRREGGGGAEA